MKKRTGEKIEFYQQQLEVYEKKGDLASQAATLWDLTNLLLEENKLQESYEYWSESHQIDKKLRRLSGVCFAGRELGETLCRDGQDEEGMKLLEIAKAGFEKLGWKKEISETKAIIDLFDNQ